MPAGAYNTGSNTGNKKHDIPDDEQDALRDIVHSCEHEDYEIRRSMSRQWKKNEEFWHGVQYLFWNSAQETWISPVDLTFDTDSDAFEQLGSFQDKVVDIFRGHGESIISALSAQVPAIRFLPDDADDPSDVLTAKTYNRIADLVIRHNKTKLLLFRTLFFLGLQGLVASYRYKESDPKYGTVDVPVYGEVDQAVTKYTCPSCDYESTEPWQAEGMESTGCPQCLSTEPAVENQVITQIPQLLKIESKAKTRVKIDIFGPLHFKVPYYARNQSECTYFLLYGDQGKDGVMAAYPDYADEIEGEGLDDEERNRFARSDYATSAGHGDEHYLVTVLKAWLRPAAFYRAKPEFREKLLQKYPAGAKVTLIGKNKILVDCAEEDLDYRWEIGQAGLSTFIHSDPFLRPLVQIQEMRNQLVNLIVETINHGISAEFADPAVLNFDTYGRFEALPGYIYKAKPERPGGRLGDSFYSSSRAVLSKEVGAFLHQLDQDAQFCVGSFPSIYGGPSEGKSRTFAEYAASRQMALQRLSIIWSMLVDWFVRTMEGCVKMYAETVVEDDKYTVEDQGNYVNIWIRYSEMQGKVGSVESEASETFPVSLTQKKDLVLKLIELNNEFINAALYDPQNRQLLKDVLALTEFKIPGDAQRIKQTLEMSELLKSPPLAPGQSSVPVDMLVDDHALHIGVIKDWLVDLRGLDAKKSNPEGYANATSHLQEHEMAMQMQMMQAGAVAPGTVAPGGNMPGGNMPGENMPANGNNGAQSAGPKATASREVTR